MIAGFLNARLEAVVPMSLRGPTGQAALVDAVIDTGYSEFLTLPRSLVTELRLPRVSSSRAILADDTLVDFDVYRVAVHWDGKVRQIAAAELGTTPLVGMALLKEHELCIQIRDGGSVAIKALD